MKVPKLTPATSQTICRLVSHMIYLEFRLSLGGIALMKLRQKAELQTRRAFAVILVIVPVRPLALRRCASLPFVDRNFQRLDRQKAQACSSLVPGRGVLYVRTARARYLFSCAWDRSTCAPTQ